MRRRLVIHAGLLAATFLTTTIAGSWWWEGNIDLRAPLREILLSVLNIPLMAQGVTYAALLLVILGAHEMGHYLACRHYRVPATLPFFIPGPPLLVGTLGAVIRIRGAIPSRKALFDIAAAGPIAGFLVALPLLAIGIARATPVPVIHSAVGQTIAQPLVSWIFDRALHGGAVLDVGSIYGAAWVGMLVTSMNLFPVGQLDGGHALFAVSPRAHRPIAFLTIGALATLVVVESIVNRAPSAYSLWLIILIVLRDRHPRLFDETDSLGPGRTAVAVILALIFVLTFIPVPISFE